VHDVTLLVADQLYRGWEAISAYRSIDKVYAEFDLTHTDTWSGSAQRRPIKRGERCEYQIDGRTVVTGFVDTVSPFYTKQEHGIRVSGRSHTADLADCSTADRQYNGQTLAQIAQAICKPFGIRVRVETGVGDAFDRFSVESETAFGAIERAARQRGVLLASNAGGDLVLTRRASGSIGAELRLGDNILDGYAEISDRDRYSLYTVTGQSIGRDNWYGEQAATPKAAVTDPGIKRYRPRRIDAEHQGAGAALLTRAEWERNIRAGRGTRIEYTVQGWYASSRQLWEPNWLVRVVDAYLDLDRDLLITDCTYSLNESGTITRLGLTLPEAWDLIAIPERREPSGEWLL
jgi:prophage tail gpP-like protein